MQNANGVRLEKARKENAERLADISKRAFHTDVHCGSPGKGGPPGYDSPQAQARFMRGCDYYEILLGDVIVGALMAIKRKDRYYECCGLFVDPEYHNQGIATRAFDQLWDKYPDAERWKVGTPVWNTRTNYFYQKLGFYKIGTDGPDGIVYEKVMDQQSANLVA
ncbi:MAG: GNAT family N-acetyltransferase [Chloroflexi bacterium]|nr:GNAT family N-acetyltransferase [Chloroflexota bacterium]